MYSLQRRRERYRIIYIWKILEGLVPNISHGGDGGIKKLHTARNGRTSQIPTLNRTTSAKVLKLREGSLNYHGSQLFNALPKEIRDLSNCSVEIFKNKLDKYLNSIYDEPLVRGYTAGRRTESNSLIHMIPLFRTESRALPISLEARGSSAKDERNEVPSSASMAAIKTRNRSGPITEP